MNVISKLISILLIPTTLSTANNNVKLNEGNSPVSESSITQQINADSKILKTLVSDPSSGRNIPSTSSTSSSSSSTFTLSSNPQLQLTTLSPEDKILKLQNQIQQDQLEIQTLRNKIEYQKTAVPSKNSPDATRSQKSKLLVQTRATQNPKTQNPESCPKFIKVSNCENIDFNYIKCYWPKLSDKCEKLNYTLYFQKGSDAKKITYTCKNPTFTKLDFKHEYTFYQAYEQNWSSIYKTDSNSTVVQNTCYLPKFDASNTGTTYTFFIKQQKYKLTSAVPESFMYQNSKRNIKLIKPPEELIVEQKSVGQVHLSWLVPDNPLLLFTDVEYLVEYKIVTSDIEKAKYLVNNQKQNQNQNQESTQNQNQDTSSPTNILLQENITQQIITPKNQKYLDISNLEKSKTYEFSVKVRYFESSNTDNNFWSDKSNVVQILMISDNHRLQHLNSLNSENYEGKYRFLGGYESNFKPLNDPEILKLNLSKESKLAFSMVIVLGVLSILAGCCIILCGYSFVNRRKLKRYAVDDIPHASIRVRLGQNDKSLANNPFNKRNNHQLIPVLSEKEKQNETKIFTTDLHVNYKLLPAHHETHKKVTVNNAVNLVSNKFSKLRHNNGSVKTTIITHNGKPTKSIISPDLGEHQWDPVTVPLVALHHTEEDTNDSSKQNLTQNRYKNQATPQNQNQQPNLHPGRNSPISNPHAPGKHNYFETDNNDSNHATYMVNSELKPDTCSYFNSNNSCFNQSHAAYPNLSNHDLSYIENSKIPEQQENFEKSENIIEQNVGLTLTNSQTDQNEHSSPYSQIRNGLGPSLSITPGQIVQQQLRDKEILAAEQQKQRSKSLRNPVRNLPGNRINNRFHSRGGHRSNSNENSIKSLETSSYNGDVIDGFKHDSYQQLTDLVNNLNHHQSEEPNITRMSTFHSMNQKQTSFRLESNLNPEIIKSALEECLKQENSKHEHGLPTLNDLKKLHKSISTSSCKDLNDSTHEYSDSGINSDGTTRFGGSNSIKSNILKFNLNNRLKAISIDMSDNSHSDTESMNAEAKSREELDVITELPKKTMKFHIPKYQQNMMLQSNSSQSQNSNSDNVSESGSSDDGNSCHTGYITASNLTTLQSSILSSTTTASNNSSNSANSSACSSMNNSYSASTSSSSLISKSSHNFELFDETNKLELIRASHCKSFKRHRHNYIKHSSQSHSRHHLKYYKSDDTDTQLDGNSVTSGSSAGYQRSMSNTSSENSAAGLAASARHANHAKHGQNSSMDSGFAHENLMYQLQLMAQQRARNLPGNRELNQALPIVKPNSNRQRHRAREALDSSDQIEISDSSSSSHFSSSENLSNFSHAESTSHSEENLSTLGASETNQSVQNNSGSAVNSILAASKKSRLAASGVSTHTQNILTSGSSGKSSKTAQSSGYILNDCVLNGRILH